MSKVKVRVIKRFSTTDVLGHVLTLPSGEVLDKCKYFKEGQEMIIDRLTMPENFCPWAWRDLYKDLSVLYFGGNFLIGPGIQYTSCSDGKKPVCFKLR